MSWHFTLVVKPGFCPYKVGGECSADLKSCLSDEDCNSSSKCCKSACGSKCVPFLLTSGMILKLKNTVFFSVIVYDGIFFVCIL